MPSEPWFPFPNGKRFAFTILDDTDVATVENVSPVYDLLHRLGMGATKTVWPVSSPEGSRDFSSSETLEDPQYRQFVRGLVERGFEITWHGATMESSTRERTFAALREYFDVLGSYPRIHVNHAGNRENLYWGAARLDSSLIRMLVGRFKQAAESSFEGHVESSPYWWGDLCARYITYARNLTTTDVNTARFNPSMPYRDPRRPLVPWWFSASDADDVDEFNALLHPKNQERLERVGGFCIVATHFGKRFAENGAVNPTTEALLTALARRRGWFPSTGQLLDWLRARREVDQSHGLLPAGEWRRMQWRWGLDRCLRQLRRWRR